MSHPKYDFCYPIAGIRDRVLAGCLLSNRKLFTTLYFTFSVNSQQSYTAFHFVAIPFLYSIALLSKERNTVLESWRLKVSAIHHLALSSTSLQRFTGPTATQLNYNSPTSSVQQSCAVTASQLQDGDTVSRSTGPGNHDWRHHMHEVFA